MHHKRVVQEKNRLLGDIKRLKTHYEGYEAMAKSLRGKYESAMKEKMLVRLERDRLAGKVYVGHVLGVRGDWDEGRADWRGVGW